MMMKRAQSKKMNQLKYLLLIPALVSMLFYTSCSTIFTKSKENQKKQLQTKFRNSYGKLVTFKGYEKTYLDDYMGDTPPNEMKEILFKDLTKNEKEEFKLFFKNFNESLSTKVEISKFKFFRMPNGRNAYGTIESGLNFMGKGDGVEERKEVSFMIIDKAPTFPGCESGDKDCFSKMVQKHFSKNFDAKMVNGLGLSAGKKRIFIGFKIDKEGNILEVKARAPHINIKEEVLSVMGSLPKMIPGENKGEKVNVNYSIPFTIVVK